MINKPLLGPVMNSFKFSESNFYKFADARLTDICDHKFYQHSSYNCINTSRILSSRRAIYCYVILMLNFNTVKQHKNEMIKWQVFYSYLLLNK